MRIIKNEKIENALNIVLNGDEYLAEILKYKLWHYGEAINYVLGVYKVAPYITDSESESENSILTLSGEHITESNNSDLMAYLLLETNRLHEIWKHSALAENQTPDFFISWAFEYDVEIPWLSYAKENGLISDKSSKANVDNDKPLDRRLKGGYLRLILSLCYEIPNFDINQKPFTIARLIKDRTGIKLSLETLAGYIDEAKQIANEEQE